MNFNNFIKPVAAFALICGAPLLQASAWQLPLGPTTVQATATDVAGHTTTASATATVGVTHGSLAALTARFVDGALGSSLLAQLNASSRAAAAGNTTASNNALSAYEHEVLAQTDKAISAAHASALLRFAAALRR